MNILVHIKGTKPHYWAGVSSWHIDGRGLTVYREINGTQRQVTGYPPGSFARVDEVIDGTGDVVG